MDKTALVEADVGQGADVIKVLDDAGFDVHSALWMYYPEPGEWRLIIATHLVDESGPVDAYKRLYKILEGELPDLNLSSVHIQLVSPALSLIQVLRKGVKTGKGISSIRFSHNVVNGVYIEDALLYRVQ